MAKANRFAGGRPVAALGAALTLLLLAAGPLTPRAEAQAARPPYWASITQVPAIMRRGPSREMPADWRYLRDNLPVRVIAVYEDWRQVEDPDGQRGWMHSRLLSAARTALVTGGTRPLRVSPAPEAAVAYRAEAGVVGQLGECDGDWCLIDVAGRSGWIAADHIWGDGAP